MSQISSTIRLIHGSTDTPMPLTALTTTISHDAAPIIETAHITSRSFQFTDKHLPAGPSNDDTHQTSPVVTPVPIGTQIFPRDKSSDSAEEPTSQKPSVHSIFQPSEAQNAHSNDKCDENVVLRPDQHVPVDSSLVQLSAAAPTTTYQPSMGHSEATEDGSLKMSLNSADSLQNDGSQGQKRKFSIRSDDPRPDVVIAAAEVAGRVVSSLPPPSASPLSGIHNSTSIGVVRNSSNPRASWSMSSFSHLQQPSAHQHANFLNNNNFTNPSNDLSKPLFQQPLTISALQHQSSHPQSGSTLSTIMTSPLGTGTSSNTIITMNAGLNHATLPLSIPATPAILFDPKAASHLQFSRGMMPNNTLDSCIVSPSISRVRSNSSSPQKKSRPSHFIQPIQEEGKAFDGPLGVPASSSGPLTSSNFANSHLDYTTTQSSSSSTGLKTPSLLEPPSVSFHTSNPSARGSLSHSYINTGSSLRPSSIHPPTLKTEASSMNDASADSSSGSGFQPHLSQINPLFGPSSASKQNGSIFTFTPGSQYHPSIPQSLTTPLMTQFASPSFTNRNLGTNGSNGVPFMTFGTANNNNPVSTPHPYYPSSLPTQLGPPANGYPSSNHRYTALHHQQSAMKQQGMPVVNNNTVSRPTYQNHHQHHHQINNHHNNTNHHQHHHHHQQQQPHLEKMPSSNYITPSVDDGMSFHNPSNSSFIASAVGPQAKRRKKGRSIGQTLNNVRGQGQTAPGARKICYSCKTRSSVYWRDAWVNNENIPITLCNGCCLRYKKCNMACNDCLYIPYKCDESWGTTCKQCAGKLEPQQGKAIPPRVLAAVAAAAECDAQAAAAAAATPQGETYPDELTEQSR